MNPSHLNRLLLLSICAVVAFAAGCASSKQSGDEASSSSSSSSPDKLKKDRDLQGVWVKPGFSFSGKPGLFIEPTAYKAVERPNEVQMREFATREVREQIAAAARDTGVFGSVSTDAAAPTNSLRLVNTIVEYEKGGGGARYFAGLYGGGQPVINVRGEMFDASNERVFVYEAKRSGEKASARLVGVFLSDEEIQRNDIHDLAIDLVDFMMRTAGLTPPKR